VRLWIGTPNRPVAVLEADNCRNEWGGRVVALLELLAPHLGLLLRRATMRVAASDGGGVLTARELEVLSLVAEGRTNGELARILWISPNTVRKHLENAFDKLGVHTRTAAVARVFERPG
jgi:DNA-binding CsgD family transcriptional regulator